MHEETNRLLTALEEKLAPVFAEIDETRNENQLRVLNAFRKEQVAARHFTQRNGYGYDDIGRDTLDRLFADAFEAEDALVRPQFVNGSHAIFTALAALLEPGDLALSVTGRPYDTLEEAIGLCGDAPGNLKRFGVTFSCVELNEQGAFDWPAIEEALAHGKPRLFYVQRSRGYAWRLALNADEMERGFARLKRLCPSAWIFVDNCYGEFTQRKEPTAIGADLMAGSLIKNPGGGLAPCGGYAAGRRELVERVAYRLTVPGMGREVGAYEGGYRPFYQGLFLAPSVTADCLKTAALFAALFEKMGLKTMPASDARRSDIIQAVQFGKPEGLIAFCRAIQKASPIDSFVQPEPWAMPGYQDPVIMAAGAFVQGATTELSADGPLRPPYTAYLQGSLCYAHGRIAAGEVYETLKGL